MATARGSTIVLIRGGEGIQESTSPLPDTIAAILEIDSTVPLRNRGMVPDCRRVFDLDFYIPDEIRYFFEAEERVKAHRKYGPMYDELKEKVFRASPMEADNWDEIRVQRIDAHGSGALWIQGILKVFLAMIGRPFEPEPNKRDAQVNIVRQSEKRGPHKNEIWVSLFGDLFQALVELHPDEVGLVCGAFGGTGPAVSAVLGEVLADLKHNVVRVQLISMPDAFMVNGSTPSEVADRLAAIIDVLGPLALYDGLGQDGVFWRFLGEHMRTIGERFSNVMAKKIAFGCAAAITICGVPLRGDLEERWLVGHTALNRIDDDNALARLQMALERDLVRYDVVAYMNGQGVRIRVQTPNKLKLWQWELLLPALSAARAGVGRMKLPVEVVVQKGGFFRSERKEMKHLPVESVPEMDKLLAKAGVKSIDRLSEAIAFWALTLVERKILTRFRQLPLDEVIAQAKSNFVQTMREILSDLIFNSPLFPPQSAVYEEPATAFFMWGQVNLSPRALADTLCGYFAKVDRTDEEREAMRRAEQERQAVLMDRVAELAARFEGEEE